MFFSPQITLMQASLELWVFTYAVVRAYQYDKCRCLKFWRFKRKSSSFQRLMMIGYMAGLPTYSTQSILMSVIKYQVGFLPVSMGGFPVPPQFWNAQQLTVVPPAKVLWVLALTTEIVVHSEEMFYWLHLTLVKPDSKRWFDSWAYKSFLVSAVVFPCVQTVLAAVSFGDEAKMALWTAVAFAVGLTIQNSVFTFFILPRFPVLLQKLAEAGAPSSLICRLRTVDRYNRQRVLARWIFTIAMGIVDIYGLLGKTTLYTKSWAMDILFVIGFPGYTISAVLTLIIFLPLDTDSGANVIYEGITGGNNLASRNNNFTPTNISSRDLHPIQPQEFTAVARTPSCHTTNDVGVRPPSPSASRHHDTVRTSTTIAPGQSSVDLEKSMAPPSIPHPYANWSLRNRNRSHATGYAISGIHPDALIVRSTFESGVRKSLRRKSRRTTVEEAQSIPQISHPYRSIRVVPQIDIHTRLSQITWEANDGQDDLGISTSLACEGRKLKESYFE